MTQPVALITGAGRGIGRAAAIALAKSGRRLALVSRNEHQLKETAESAGNGLILPADVTSAERMEQVVGRTIVELGRLDAIVHCAGVALSKPIASMSVAQWQTTIDTNLSSAFYLWRAAWPQFERQRAGVFVNISSIAARNPLPGLGAYGTAKAALNLFGLAAAREGEPIGVRVHTIAPGAVETEMFRNLFPPDRFPPERTLPPQDVAAVIVQCVNGELRHASGEVIYVHQTL